MRVSNGKESYNVQEENLQKAQADGFYPVVQVTNGTDTYDVRPENVAKARAEGFAPFGEDLAKRDAIEQKGLTGLSTGEISTGLGLLMGGTAVKPALRAAKGLLSGAPASISSTGGLISAPKGGGILKPAARAAMGKAWKASKPYLKEGAKWVLGYEVLKGLLRNAPALIPQKERAHPMTGEGDSQADEVSRRPQSLELAEPVYRNVSGIGSPTGPYKSGLAYNLAGMRSANPLRATELVSEKPRSEDWNKWEGELQDYEDRESFDRSVIEDLASPELGDIYKQRIQFYQDAEEQSARAEEGGDYELDPWEYYEYVKDDHPIPFARGAKARAEEAANLRGLLDESSFNEEQEEKFLNRFFRQDPGLIPREDFGSHVKSAASGPKPDGAEYYDPESNVYLDRFGNVLPDTREMRIHRQNQEALEEYPNWLWGPSPPKKSGLIR